MYEYIRMFLPEGGTVRRGAVDAGAEAFLDLELFLIVRQEGEIIGKLGRDQRSGVRDQKRKELGWVGRRDLGGWGLDRI
jgi:hypothetical protein